MRYVSLFSGIEATSVAWKPLGWEPVAFSEIEKFPCAVLVERFPDVPNLGDITKIDWSCYAGSVDLVVGGSPCQSFSVAGNREGLSGASGLMFEYIRAIRELMPRYFVWENVPGALSSEGGRAFGQLLREMDDLGYGLAWRVLDAQFFGVPQRRRRVFLVGCLGDAERAAEVLFEHESLRWDNPPSRAKRQELAAAAGRGTASGCLNPVDAPAVLAFDTTQITSPANGNNPQWGGPCHPLCANAHVPAVAFSAGQSSKAGSLGHQEEVAPTLRGGSSGTNQVPTICLGDDAANASCDVKLAGTLKCGGMSPAALTQNIVRRLMPVECERLQGFPDGWTLIPYRGKPAEECPDSPRYRALGNSMAVPVMAWIGKRIAAVETAFGEE